MCASNKVTSMGKRIFRLGFKVVYLIAAASVTICLFQTVRMISENKVNLIIRLTTSLGINSFIRKLQF